MTPTDLLARVEAAKLTDHERFLLDCLSDGNTHGCNESGSSFLAYRKLVALGLAEETGSFALDFDTRFASPTQAAAHSPTEQSNERNTSRKTVRGISG